MDFLRKLLRNKFHNLNGNTLLVILDKKVVMMIKKYIKVPYIKGVSEHLQRTLKPYDITLSNNSSNSISS